MPAHDRRLAEIVTLAVDAAVRPEALNEVSDRIVETYGLGAFMIYEYDMRTHRGPRFSGSRALREAEDLLASLASGENDEDPRGYEAIARMAPHQFRSEVDLLNLPSGAQLADNRFRDQALALTGSTARHAAKLNDVGPWVDVVGMHSFQPAAEVPEQVSNDLAFLLPVLAKAVETSRVVYGLTASYRLLLNLFDGLDFGAAFTDADGRVVLANAAFRNMTADRDGLTEASGIAGATDHASSSRLRAALTAALTPNAKPRDATVTLTRRSGRLPLIARAAPVHERDVRRDETLVLLLVIDPEDSSRVSADGLAAFGLLTPAELEVVNHLVQGLPTEEIAERRSASVEATHSQIDEAAAKLACTSRLDLLRLAMATNMGRAPK